MAKSRKSAPKPATGPAGVVRRPSAERKRLPPELEAFARSDDTRLRDGRAPRPRLRDPRPTALVPGVANRDARLVYDHRIGVLQDAAGRREDPAAREELARLLAEAVLLGLWRGRSLTGFDAFAQDILGIDYAEARALAERGAAALGVAADRCTEEGVAAWFRAEAGLVEAGLPGTVRVLPIGGEEVLKVEVPVSSGPPSLHAIGRRMTPLVRDREEAAAEAAKRAEERAARMKRRGPRDRE